MQNTFVCGVPPAHRRGRRDEWMMNGANRTGKKKATQGHHLRLLADPGAGRYHPTMRVGDECGAIVTSPSRKISAIA
jgi:hypothetical protein